MSAEHGNPSSADRQAGCLGAVIVGGLIWCAIYLPGCPDRAVRVWQGSDRSEDVGDDPAPTTTEGTAACSLVELVNLDFTDTEGAATLLGTNEPTQGAIVDCPDETFSSIGAGVTAQELEAYEQCKILRPNFEITQSRTGQFVVACV